MEGAPATNFNGDGYNPDCVANVGYGNQGQGYTQYSLINNPSSRPPFNPNNGQGNFHQGYNNHVPYDNQVGGSFPRPNGNRPYSQVLCPNPNQPYPATQPPPNPAPSHNYITTKMSTLTQLNQTLIAQMTQLQAQ